MAPFLTLSQAKEVFGKSYGAKKYVTNHFIKKNKQFVYIRRYKTELEEALFKDKAPIFFEQIKKEFPNDKLTNTKQVFKINDKIARLRHSSFYFEYFKVSNFRTSRHYYI